MLKKLWNGIKWIIYGFFYIMQKILYVINVICCWLNDVFEKINDTVKP